MTHREDSPENSVRELEAAEKLILRWDSTASDDARDRMIFDSERHEADRYLWAVDEICRTMEATSISGGDSSKATGTIQIAMARLEDEFRNILTIHSSPLDLDQAADSIHSSVSSSRTEFDGDDDDDEEEEDQDRDHPERSSSSSFHHRMSASSIREIDPIPSEAISDLRSIADRMVSAGYSRECVQAYGSVRKPVLDSSFRQLGIERLSIGDIQKLEWADLEVKIKRWIRAARIFVRILFATEKRLCEQIFAGLDPVDDTCFKETVKGSAIQLFNFVEAISISRRSPEKLFKMLDLHEALSDLQSDIADVFSSNSSESIRIQADEILSRLAEAVRGILSEFENAIQREPSRPVPGGTIHPLTRYVMNYINLISDYRQGLILLITTKPSPGSRFSEDSLPETDYPELGTDSPIAAHLIWIMIVLHLNLDNKSKLYKDVSLSHLFLMNNVHYIVHKVKGTPELRELIGDDWLRKLTGKFQQSAISYERATWVRILSCLRDEGIHVSGGFSSGVSKTALKERFKSFNSAFEEVHRIQATWFVPDPQLREELRISIAAKLLPAYRSFLGRFRHHLESGRHSDMYIKYSADDLESALLDFFEGSPVSLHLRRGSH